MKAFNTELRMLTVGMLLMAIAGQVSAQQAYPNKPGDHLPQSLHTNPSR